MLYSKITKPHQLRLINVNPLENCKFEDDDIFYHYTTQPDIKIYDSIDANHWEHIRNNKNVKLLHINTDETFDYNFILDLHQLITRQSIDPNQIYIILPDSLHKDYLTEELKKLNVHGVNIGIHGNALLKTYIPKNINDIKSNKKFSALSRNFKPWRLRLYLSLLENDLLEDFTYSFSNLYIHRNTLVDIESVVHEGKIQISERGKEWLSKIPYTLANERDGVYKYNIWINPSFDAILSSDFNLVVETHYERKIIDSSVTEKTYKAFACNKPFLMFGVVGFLADLKKMGFKTFSPYIDETYDTIADNEQRLSALVHEINRIQKLNNSDYKKLLDNCNVIADENFKIFQEKQAIGINEDNFTPSFEFIKPYLKKYEGWDFPIVIL
jgi:hypothetical protein